ncbi:MAG: S-adenosylmethionine decarboxylase [Selenomonadaceae bacterium]|nr:S-adenosylmethionine decarboxylase [Selenomonadaceae bacterium]
MKILARQLTLDLYNCNDKKFIDLNALKTVVEGVLGSDMNIISTNVDNEHSALVAAFKGGHIALHIYAALKYVAVDIFTCDESEDSEELAKGLRKFFQPDKIKSTYLKRGDFGLEKEIKPKTKVRVAPLRKVRNVGAKVVQKLVRGGN